MTYEDGSKGCTNIIATYFHNFIRYSITLLEFLFFKALIVHFTSVSVIGILSQEILEGKLP